MSSDLNSQHSNIQQDVFEKTPLITIGLPVYNGEKYLRRTIDSVLAQTYHNFELIICDNASTDRTLEIVESYAQKDTRIRIHRQKTNLGAIPNYRLTLELANGKYFKWIAADDVITADFLDKCLSFMEDRPEVILTYSQAAFIDNDDKIIYFFDDVMNLEAWSPDPVKRMRQHMTAILRDGSAANVFVFGLARTDILKGLEPLGNYFGCDYVYTADVFLHGEIYEYPEVMSFYRRHEDSSSSYKKAPSAKKQQQFYDPSITGILKTNFQLRRRYIELFRIIFDSDLNIVMKFQVMFVLIQRIIWRLRWRAKYEYDTKIAGMETKIQPKNTELVGKQWQEI